MSDLMLNRAHHPITTLGPGIRAGLWTQGCTIGCRNCASQDTWATDPDRSVPAAEIVGWLDSLSPLDGLTITGGEPFQQVEALTALLLAVRAWAAPWPRPLDILIYSGYAQAALARIPGAGRALALCDAVITGPYVDRLNPGARWRGSSNQKLTVLSELGQARFGRDDDVDENDALQARLQASSDGDRMWFIGVPRRGDLPRLEKSLRERGIELGETSWPG